MRSVTPAVAVVGVLEVGGHDCGRLLGGQGAVEGSFHLEWCVWVVAVGVGVEHSRCALTEQGAVSVWPVVGKALVQSHLATEDAGDSGESTRATGGAASEQVQEGGQDGQEVWEARCVGRPESAQQQHTTKLLASFLHISCLQEDIRLYSQIQLFTFNTLYLVWRKLTDIIRNPSSDHGRS